MMNWHQHLALEMGLQNNDQSANTTHQHFDSQSTEDVVFPQLVYSSTIDELHQSKVDRMHCWPGE